MKQQTALAHSGPADGRRLDWVLGLVLALTAGIFAGWNAWQEQQTRTYPLDLDGWGSLANRIKVSQQPLESIFGPPSLWKGPVVPFLFGLCYAAVPSDSSILVFNVLAFAGAAALFFFGFRALGAGRFPAAAAVLAWSVFPPHRFIFGYYYAEPVLALLVALITLLAAQTISRNSPFLALVTGAASGILLLARAPFLLSVVGLALLLGWWAQEKKGRLIFSFFGGLVVTFAPWGIRNYLTFHEIIPFTTEGGKILFQGTYLPGDDAEFNTIRTIAEVRDLESKEKDLNELEAYRYWKELAFKQARENPLGQLSLCVRKTIRFWTYLPPYSWRPGWKTFAVALVVVPFAAVGLWLGRRQLLVQICALWVVGLWAFYALVHSEYRYNFPILPLAFLLALVGISQLFTRLVSRGRSRSPSAGSANDTAAGEKAFLQGV